MRVSTNYGYETDDGVDLTFLVSAGMTPASSGSRDEPPSPAVIEDYTVVLVKVNGSTAVIPSEAEKAEAAFCRLIEADEQIRNEINNKLADQYQEDAGYLRARNRGWED